VFGEEAVELLFDRRGLRRLRGEPLDVAVALQVAGGGQQFEMQAFETLLLTQHTATAEPGEHRRGFAAVSTLDAPLADRGDPRCYRRLRTMDEATTIRFYETTKPYGCFSNVSRHPIAIDGHSWPTSEHYFQAQKFLDAADVEAFCLAATPFEAAVGHGGARARDKRSRLHRPGRWVLG
jgi:hypothetical protein